jgi:hypothetical protein
MPLLDFHIESGSFEPGVQDSQGVGWLKGAEALVEQRLGVFLGQVSHLLLRCCA